MTDTISRQAAIDAVKRKQDDGKGDLSRFYNTIIQHDIEAIMQLPSAQPDIIYCGECAKMKVDSVFHDCWCSETGKKVWINHYCGYAERKEVTT